MKHHLFQISLVTECEIKRIGNLPFDFSSGGACGTFIINSLPTILLCFDGLERKKCRLLTRRNDGSLSDITNFVFETEFEVNMAVPISAHYRWLATIANYLGFPLVLGGYGGVGGDIGNNKLEMLDTMKSPPVWIEYEDYPYSKT